MISLRLLSFLSFFVVLVHPAPPRFRYPYCFNDKGNYTANSTYHNNLKTLLSNLTSNTKIDYGFYNFSYGQNSDKVNAIGLCRGDLKPDDCRGCLNNATVLLPQLCPNQKEAMGFYDECMIRYSNRSIFGVLESNFSLYLWNVKDAPEKDKFNQVVRKLLERLRSKAAAGDSRQKFSVTNETGGDFQTIYGGVQCTPDLSEQECEDCLAKAISEIPKCCEEKRGGRVLKPSCNIRYENYRFYDPAADAPAPALAPSLPPLAPSLPPLAPSSPPQESPFTPPTQSTNANSSKGKSSTLQTVIAIVVPIVALGVLFILIFIYFRMRKQKRTINIDTEDDDEIKTVESLQFDFETIEVATNNFSDANKLGEGGFGPVYKGRLSSGQEVAVKRLSRDSSKGDTEFKNEVLLVSKLQHRHLVRLLGFCSERRERLLVYEFVPNKSLDYFIFELSKRAQFDWERRFKIIEGIARGLLYLHEDSQLRIIHRDLKASNILLDDKMLPKISDFGVAKLVSMDQSQGNTSRIVGTIGYMAPEYASHGQFSIKSDVYSFGVLVLEIVSGQKISSTNLGENEENLLKFAWKNWREGKAFNIVDPELNNGLRNEIMRCIHMGLLCVQENVADRPTMGSVLLMLNSYSLTLPVPSQPAFLTNSRSLPEMQSWENSSGTRRMREPENDSVQASENEASISEFYPR